MEVNIKLVLLSATGVMLLSTLADMPVIAILLFDLLLCWYLASLFQSKYRVAFYLHPIILLLSSQLFVTPFLNAGDASAYAAVVKQYLNIQDLTFDASKLLQAFGILGFFKYASLGVAPVYAVPEFFFGTPQDNIYYLWQGTFHVALCAIVAGLARTWNIFEEKALFSIVLFAVVSPSFFDLGSAPTRHVVTFFGVFLIFITHFAVMKKLTFIRAVWYAIAILIVLISKAPLLLPYMVFTVIDLIIIRRIKINLQFGFLMGLLVAGAATLGGYFVETTIFYEEGITAQGANTFSGTIQLPLIGWVIKYVYALLSPFPWYEAPLFTATTYAGNGLLFFMHTLSSLIGVYLFFVVILKWRDIWESDTELKGMVAYAVVMSLSILRGATGFHTYLLIYFPMLTPLLLIKRFRINLLIPICFVGLLEVFVGLTK